MFVGALADLPFTKALEEELTHVAGHAKGRW